MNNELENFYDKDKKFRKEFLKDKNPEEIAELYSDIVLMQHIYGSAIAEITTKLKVLDQEFKLTHSHSPIHNMKSRIKSPHSIAVKCILKGRPVSIKDAMNELNDIAGIRVICNYIKDVYDVAEMLTKQEDIEVLSEKDYIKNPKPSGYRSYHIVVTIPVFFSKTTKKVPVELQFRTIGMDFWASLEHGLNYKSQSDMDSDLKNELFNCAKSLNEIDVKMQNIHNKTHK